MNEQRNGTLTTADVASAGQAEGQDPIDSFKDEERIPASSLANSPREALIPNGDSRQREWEEIQGRFVDQTRASVEAADGLVAEVIQQMASKFAEERSKLESQWQAGTESSTEDLRLAMQHYRNFFRRLLAA